MTKLVIISIYPLKNWHLYDLPIGESWLVRIILFRACGVAAKIPRGSSESRKRWWGGGCLVSEKFNLLMLWKIVAKNIFLIAVQKFAEISSWNSRITVTFTYEIRKIMPYFLTKKSTKMHKGHSYSYFRVVSLCAWILLHRIEHIRHTLYVKTQLNSCHK